MQVLAPITVTDAMLLSSTLAETEHAAWASGTTYAKGVRAIKAHKVWESAVGSNTNHDPVDDTAHAWWLEVGPTNRWAMFDEVVSTASRDSTDITVEIAPGAYVDAVALVAGIGGTARVQVHDGPALVYDRTQPLDSTPIMDWADYFFADQQLAGELLFQGLPRYLSAAITVTLTAAAGEAALGALVLGRLHDLGGTLTGASAGITDYSRKEADAFGNTILLRRAYAKRSQQRLMLDALSLRRVHAVLSELRATPAVWIGALDTALFGPLVVYGWFRSFSIDIRGPVYSYCSLEIEGLT